MDSLKKAYRIFSTAEKYFLFIIFFFATVMVVINVFGRKLFNFSFNWLEELNRYILVICTFIGSAIATTDGLHPRMDMVVGLMKGKRKLALEIISSAILTIFLAFMTYYAFQQLSNMLLISAMTATLKVPVYVFFAFIPIGFCGMAIRSAICVLLFIGELVRPESKKGADE